MKDKRDAAKDDESTRQRPCRERLWRSHGLLLPGGMQQASTSARREAHHDRGILLTAYTLGRQTRCKFAKPRGFTSATLETASRSSKPCRAPLSRTGNPSPVRPCPQQRKRTRQAPLDSQ